MMRLFFLLTMMLVLVSCSSDGPVIEAVNEGWPNGTVLMALDDGTVAGSTVLYGDHTRITLGHEGVYRLRISAGSQLTAFTEQFSVNTGVNRIELPKPISRRRIENRIFGLSVTGVSPVTLPDVFLSDENLYLTTLTVSASTAGTFVADAHRRLTELTALITLTGSEVETLDTDSVAVMMDSLAVLGVDGVVFNLADITESPRRLHNIRLFVSAAHNRGMTMALMVDDNNLSAGNWYPLDAPVTEQPDEVRFTVPAAVTASEMDVIVDRLNTCIAGEIPPDRVSLVFSLAANAIDTATGEFIAPIQAELDSLIAVSGGGVIRLRDGSCRFGYGGVSYRFDDPAGIAAKIRYMRDVTGITECGVHVYWNGTGVKLDSAGLETIASAVAGTE